MMSTSLRVGFYYNTPDFFHRRVIGEDIPIKVVRDGDWSRGGDSMTVRIIIQVMITGRNLESPEVSFTREGTTIRVNTPESRPDES